jgi:hypothetical protein
MGLPAHAGARVTVAAGSAFAGSALRRIRTVVVLASLLWSGSAVRAAAQDSYLFVITGVAGDEEHAKRFQKWATTLIDAAKTKDGVPDANIVYLAEKPDADAARIRGRSTSENVQKAIADLAAKAHSGDQVVIVLIGHGSFDGNLAVFSMPGPDMTVADWASLLKKLSAQKVAFINTTSSSGAFLPAVAASGRTVVTATKTGGERNEAMFGEFFVEAFGDSSADADRNGHVSVLEAFNYANNKVVKAYQQGGLLRTEHATLDDGGDGKLAGTQFLTAHPADGGLKVDVSDPAMRALVAEREAIQKEIDALKAKKDSVAPARYDQDMERLLTNLALKTKAIRDREAKQ